MSLDAKLDVHSYDGKIDDRVYKFIQEVGHIKNLQKVAEISIQEIKRDVYDPKKNKSNHNPNIVTHGVNCFLNNEFDGRNKTDIHTPFVIAWALCKKQQEEDLFFLQMVDMITTNGTCQQGRTSRCLQVISALME